MEKQKQKLVQYTQELSYHIGKAFVFQDKTVKRKQIKLHNELQRLQAEFQADNLRFYNMEQKFFNNCEKILIDDIQKWNRNQAFNIELLEAYQKRIQQQKMINLMRKQKIKVLRQTFINSNKQRIKTQVQQKLQQTFIKKQKLPISQLPSLKRSKDLLQRSSSLSNNTFKRQPLNDSKQQSSPSQNLQYQSSIRMKRIQTELTLPTTTKEKSLQRATQHLIPNKSVEKGRKQKKHNLLNRIGTQKSDLSIIIKQDFAQENAPLFRNDDGIIVTEPSVHNQQDLYKLRKKKMNSRKGIRSKTQASLPFLKKIQNFDNLKHSQSLSKQFSQSRFKECSLNQIDEPQQPFAQFNFMRPIGNGKQKKYIQKHCNLPQLIQMLKMSKQFYEEKYQPKPKTRIKSQSLSKSFSKSYSRSTLGCKDKSPQRKEQPHWFQKVIFNARNYEKIIVYLTQSKRIHDARILGQRRASLTESNDLSAVIAKRRKSNQAKKVKEVFAKNFFRLKKTQQQDTSTTRISPQKQSIGH